MDLCLAFINHEFGSDDAGSVQLILEYFPPSINYADINLIQTLPSKTGPDGSLKKGAERLPEYLKTSYFK